MPRVLRTQSPYQQIHHSIARNWRHGVWKILIICSHIHRIHSLEVDMALSGSLFILPIWKL